jgi:Effector Associated Constant Component 1
MSATPTQVVLRVDPGPDADDEELAELALRLRDDLQALDVGPVQLSRGGTAPAGAKSVDPIEWGTLLVAIGSSPALLTLIRTANAWLARQRQGRVRVKIGDDELELTGASTDDQRRLIDDWLARRGAEPGGDA